MTMVIHKNSSPKVFNCNRLVGGADIPKKSDKSEESAVLSEPIFEVLNSSSPFPIPPPPPSLPVRECTQPGISSQEKSSLPASGPCCSCVSQTPGLVGDKKIDEIIEFVHQNLHEAGKALATLGKNFEHDIKLIFVDILGRIQQWSGIVQNKLDICKNEINNLRKELLARICEIDVKAREVADLKAQIADYQNAKKVYGKTVPEAKYPENAVILEAEQSIHDGMTAMPITQKVQTVITKKIEDKDKEDKEERRREHLVYAGVAVQTTMQEKDRIRRESELESEVSRLRKEHDRIMKERAEYENAIQRALLRGVSSLNVEALKVLRCPPIPCCIPCAPCPATTTIPPEPVIPCPSKNVKRRSGFAATAVCNAKVPYNENVRNSDNDQTYSTTRRTCATTCCSMGRNRKMTDSSMIFLLRQGDQENLCAADEGVTPDICASPIMKKIDIPPYPKFGK